MIVGNNFNRLVLKFGEKDREKLRGSKGLDSLVLPGGIKIRMKVLIREKEMFFQDTVFEIGRKVRDGKIKEYRIIISEDFENLIVEGKTLETNYLGQKISISYGA